MLGYTMGQAVILRGDARCLPLVSADCVITSPPYQVEAPGLPSGTGAGAVSGQHGNRYTRPPGADVDVVITSPPYEGTNVQRSESLGDSPFGGPHSQARGDGYTRPVDAIVTSPSFEKQDTSAHPGQLEGMLHTMGRANRNGTGHESGGNVGNERGAQYWTSMSKIYAECWRVLRPGGIMALVLKGFTRDGKYIDLPGQTEAMLLEAGWQKHDHWRRELWSLSFWRILQKRRDPAAFDDRLNYEEVLAFRKPEGQGRGVDTVITSPPYEGSVESTMPGTSRGLRTRLFGEERKDQLSQVGQMLGYTRPVSVIITSPPYEGVADSTKNTNTNDAARGHPTKPMAYTRPAKEPDA